MNIKCGDWGVQQIWTTLNNSYIRKIIFKLSVAVRENKMKLEVNTYQKMWVKEFTPKINQLQDNLNQYGWIKVSLTILWNINWILLPVINNHLLMNMILFIVHVA